MGLCVHPSTGALIGLSTTITVSEHLERIRRSNQGNESRWFACFSAFGLAYRNYKTHLFAAKYPECPHRVLNRVVVHQQEEFGGFELCETTSAAPQLLGEVKLLVSCAWNSVFSNSVRYEFGYRWYHQTLYNQQFRASYMELLGITPVLHIGSSFAEECLKANPEGKSNKFDLDPGPIEDRSLPVPVASDSESDTLVSQDEGFSTFELEQLQILSGAPNEDDGKFEEDAVLCSILRPIVDRVDYESGPSDKTNDFDDDELSLFFEMLLQQLGDMGNRDPRVRKQIKGLWCYDHGCMAQLAYKFGYVFPELTFDAKPGPFLW